MRSLQLYIWPAVAGLLAALLILDRWVLPQYRDVHNHLARGADRLCHGRGPVALGQLGDPADSSEIPPQLADVRPPLDYAPKASPDAKGMLAEEFGLERDRAAQPAVTAAEQDTPPTKH